MRADRWYCSRPPYRSGTCDAGPLADGRCAQQHPPCVPRRSAAGLRSLQVSLGLVLSLGLALLGLGLGWW